MVRVLQLPSDLVAGVLQIYLSVQKGRAELEDNQRWEKASSEYWSCDSTATCQHIALQTPYAGFSTNEIEDCTKVKKAPHHVALCLSGIPIQQWQHF